MLEVLLREIERDEQIPDVSSRVVERVLGESESLEVNEQAYTWTRASESGECPPVNLYASGKAMEANTRFNRPTLILGALATCVLAFFVLLHDPDVPSQLTPIQNDSVRISPVWPPAVRSTDFEYSRQAGSTQLKSGWFLAEAGSPLLRAETTKFYQLYGRSLLVVNGPGGEVTQPHFVLGLQSLASDPQLTQHLETKEIEMIQNPRSWCFAGKLALCVLAGTALVNNQPVAAGACGQSAADVIKAYDTDKNGTLSLEEFKASTAGLPTAEAESLFAMIDSDGNKQISEAEIKATMPDEKQLREMAGMMFTQLDANSDGSLSEVEFAKQLPGAPAADAKKAFEHLDANDDGKISKDEYVDDFVAASMGDLEYDFKRLDSNKDGKLSKDEFEPFKNDASLDTNKDGSISLEEFKEAIVIDTQAEIDKAFKAADKNNDGKLSKDEFEPFKLNPELDADKDGFISKAEFTSLATGK